MAILGISILLSSLYLLSKVVDYIYLDNGWKGDFAVGGFFITLAMFLGGGWLLLWSIGLM
jgi:hypothetical protein